MNNFHRPAGRHNVRRLVLVSVLTVLGAVVLTAPPATGKGHRAQPVGMRGEFVINGTQVTHLGGYELSGISARNAFSVGPGVGAAAGEYTRAEPAITSRRLDVLLYVLQTGLVDGTDDRSIAAASLAWWYADTRRPDGFPVWSNPAQNFAAITPSEPDWAQLPPYSDSSPVGIRVPGVDLDVAEREVANLDALIDLYAGTWTLRLVGSNTVRLESDGRPLPGVPVYYVPPNDERPPSDADMPSPPPMTTTDGNGEIDVAEVRALWAKWFGSHTDRGKIQASPRDGSFYYVPDKIVVEAPGRHNEWVSDGDGVRLATATVDRLTQELVIDENFPPAPPTTTTTTTTTTSTTSTTSTTTLPPQTTTTVAADGGGSTTTSPSDGGMPTTTIAGSPTSNSAPNSTTTSTSVANGSVGLPVGTTTQPPAVAPPSPGGSTGSGTGTPSNPNIAIPVTGPSRVVDWMLRFGDVIILVGVALVVATEFLPQRKKTTAP